MENNNEGIFSSVFNKLHSYTLYFPFCSAVESAHKNGFSIEDCKIIKDYIIQGADPNWKVGKDDETLLHLAVKNRKKDLFCFLLQHNANINAANKKGDTPFHTLMYVRGIAKLKLDRLNIDIEKLAKLKLDPNINIEDLLENGANFRAENNKGLTPLLIASFLGNSSDIRTLIKCGANINEKHSKRNHVTPLIFALCNKNPVESIKELCKLGASLPKDDKNNNTFHFITDPQAIHYIEPLITHARFDDFGKGSKKTVPFALWVLKYWNPININLSKDTKLHILAQLPLSDLYPYKKLCTELLQKNYNYILLPHVHQRVENIRQILASPNNENKTALQLMLEKFATNQEHINKLTPLLSGELLQNNYNDFITRFPGIVNSQKEEDKKNLVRQMFDNCAELFLE